MLSHSGVSFVLLIIWGIAYWVLKKKLVTSKPYFLLLIVMASAGIVLPLERWLYIGTENDFKFSIITLFGFLLIGSIIPWLRFDKFFYRIKSIRFNPQKKSIIVIVLILLVLLGVFAMAYTLPYAIIAYRLGAGEVRALIKEDSILPVSSLTTIAVGVGYLAPVYIALFFMSLSSIGFKRYSLPLFITSLTYLVTSAAAQARDGFIMIPLTYFFLYQVFRGFLPKESVRTIKRLIRVTVPVLLSFLLVITFNRFFDSSDGYQWDRIIRGTWGYFYQQPYVFDQTVQHQAIFHGIAYRFPLLGRILGEVSSGKHVDYAYKYMFGTMYSSFYSARGWGSLIIATLFFYISWTFVINKLGKRQNYFGMLIVFSLYLYFLISGLFYFRLSAESVTLAYLAIVLLSFLIKDYAIVDYKE